jgi:hypothetical protein
MGESTFIWIMITGAVFYLLGFLVGLMRNLNGAISSVLKDQPIVVRIEQVQERFLAYMILNSSKNVFVEQGASADEIVDRLREKHPGKLIIIAEIV